MEDYLTTISELYLEQAAAFQDQHVIELLRRNNIKADLTNVDTLKRLLKDAGYMLVDEVEGDFETGRQHTVSLVKIVDQTSYKINPPTLKIGEDGE